jgi:thiol:disulfide interchange protein DsbD
MLKSMFWRRFCRSAALALAPLAMVSPLAFGQPVKTPHVEAELVAERTSAAPGAAATIALRTKMAEGWHIYWRNPGDSGLPPKLEWTLPEGVRVGPIQWTYPDAIPVGPLVNYGYKGEVFHLLDVEVPATAVPGSRLDLRARAEWLVCRETCIPEEGVVALSIPVAAAPGDASRWAPAFAAARTRLPQPVPAGWQVAAEGAGATVRLRVATGDGRSPDLARARFFPYEEGRIEASGRQVAGRDGSAATLALPVASTLSGDFGRLRGILVDAAGWGGAVPGRAVEIDVPLAGTVVAGVAPAAAAPRLAVEGSASGVASTLWAAVALALVGGALLNLMPCVFPVLSLKVLGFARAGELARGELWTKGVAFTAGAVVSFWLLAALLLALKAAGQQLGWGFQLQSPAVVAALAVLFFVIGLNLAGMFEFGQFLPGSIAAWQSRRPLVDAFATGVLAVVVASPCTAPFMGAALGYALAQPAATTLAVFTALGLGMAAPFLVLSIFPGWLARLPRPGPWMVRLRQLLAFPMFATVIWLAWVLGVQLGVDGMLRLLVALLAVALGIWLLRGQAARRSAIALVFATAALAGAAAIAWPLFTGSAQAAETSRSGAARPDAAATQWEPFSPARIAELAATGRPVFVDFTAAWCVTCQVNKQLVLSRDSVLAAFRDRGVTLMRADWTRQDPEITAALQSLGRSGVPVYALFRPGREALLLPEVLQESTIREALATL